MSPVLPQELDERILELVLDDSLFMTIYETLCQCALVCRAWRTYTQSLLFGTMSFEWESGADVMSTLYDYRRFLDEHSHLASHIERLVFGLPPDKFPGHSIYGVFLQLLPPRLPALRIVRFEGYTMPYKLHRFYSAPYAPMANITTLQLSRIDIVDMTDLYHFILRFPNLSSLLIADCYWKNTRKHTIPRLRNRWRLPDIVQLGLAFGTSPSRDRAVTMPRRPDFEALIPPIIQLLLQTLGANLLLLQINLRTFEYLTSPRYTSNTSEFLSGCPMPRLQQLEIHLRCPATLNEDWFESPYSVYVARVPTLLKAIDAKDLRVLGLYFSRVEVKKSEELFLDALEGIHGELAILIEGQHFPQLQKVRLDVGARPHTHSWWNPRLAERLPLLASRDLLETVQFMFRWYRRYGPFTDPPGIRGRFD